MSGRNEVMMMCGKCMIINSSDKQRLTQREEGMLLGITLVSHTNGTNAQEHPRTVKNLPFVIQLLFLLYLPCVNPLEISDKQVIIGIFYFTVAKFSQNQCLSINVMFDKKH